MEKRTKVTELKCFFSFWNLYQQFVPIFAHCSTIEHEAVQRTIEDLDRTDNRRASDFNILNESYIPYSLGTTEKSRPFDSRSRCVQSSDRMYTDAKPSKGSKETAGILVRIIDHIRMNYDTIHKECLAMV